MSKTLLKLTTIKSLHRCTTETSEIEAKINSILNKFTTVLDYPQMVSYLIMSKVYKLT